MKRTPLYAAHQALGARFVDFGGWEMPVQYTGIIEEHQAVRQRVGLFDVSHMGEIELRGPHAIAACQELTVNDLNRLRDGQAQYSLLCRPSGGVVDDIMVHRLSGERVLLCVNAGNIDKDFAWISEHCNGAEAVNRSAAAVELTLLSAVRLCRVVLPGMRARRYGRLLFVTSLTVKQPLARMVLSNSLRAAVTALMKTLSLEAGGDGVTANCVAPGYTATERLGHLSASLAAAGGVTAAAIEAGWKTQIPAGRLGEPGEIAAAVVFLGSRAAGYVNGQTLVVDGGWTRGLV